jgi:hypothetical protein
MKMQTCEVGPFRLPGVVIEDEEDQIITEDQLTEIDDWCNSEVGTGVRMTDRLWSFRKESQRDWFLLRWSGKE